MNHKKELLRSLWVRAQRKIVRPSLKAQILYYISLISSPYLDLYRYFGAKVYTIWVHGPLRCELLCDEIATLP